MGRSLRTQNYLLPLQRQAREEQRGLCLPLASKAQVLAGSKTRLAKPGTLQGVVRKHVKGRKNGRKVRHTLGAEGRDLAHHEGDQLQSRLKSPVTGTMQHKVTLTVTSLLSILLFGSHWAYEIANGMESGGLSGLGGILILLVWLYGTLVLGDRRSGYIIMLVGGILGLVVLILHMRGTGIVGGRVANTSGVYFWVWTLIALGLTSSLSAILAARGLWSIQRGRSR